MFCEHEEGQILQLICSRSQSGRNEYITLSLIRLNQNSSSITFVCAGNKNVNPMCKICMFGFGKDSSNIATVFYPVTYIPQETMHSGTKDYPLLSPTLLPSPSPSGKDWFTRPNRNHSPSCSFSVSFQGCSSEPVQIQLLFYNKYEMHR